VADPDLNSLPGHRQGAAAARLDALDPLPLYLTVTFWRALDALRTISLEGQARSLARTWGVALEPAVLRSLSALAVQALRGGAGQIAKAKAKKRRELAEQHQARIMRAAASSIVPLLNRLEGRLTSGELTVVSRLVHRTEYYEIARMVAVAVATRELDRRRDDINAMACALVILHTGISREKAVRVAGTITQVLTTLHTSALDDLREASPDEYGRVIDRAVAEKNAGYLNSIAQRTPAIVRRRAEDLPGIALYAQRYVAALHAKVGQIVPASLDDQHAIPLEAIYVEPRFVPHDAARFRIQDDGRTGSTLGLDALLDASYRTVILGDPGAGKSTLTQKVAHQLSTDSMTADVSSQTIPLVVTLRRYETLKSSRSLSLVQYFEEVIREDFHLDAPPGAIDYLLASGDCVVLFDGLDELLDTHRRKDVADAIEAFARLYASAKILVTSRTVGYWEAPLNPGTFATVTLSDLNVTEIEEYATKWFALQPKLSPQEQQDVSRSFVRESSTIGDLRSNPLMLSLLCNVYRGARSIPQNRADLYEQCATMLFERWDEERGIHGGDVLKADAKEVLQEVAYWVFLSEGTLDPLPEKQLKRKLTRFWLKDHFESRADAEQAAISLYRSWQGRAWVLTDAGTTASGERLYRFTHRTFLEYFTAIEVVRRNPSPTRLWRAIGPHVAAGSWDIVAQIAVQVLHENYRGARRKVYEAIAADLASENIGQLERLNLLSFASRHLDALNPPPANCRALVRTATRTAVNA
jgi:GTPase SAR1 family protein